MVLKTLIETFIKINLLVNRLFTNFKNEKDYFYHYNEFLHCPDFEKKF